MGYNAPGASVHGISQAGMLEWVGIPSPGDLLAPESNPGLPHCRQILLSHRSIKIVSKPCKPSDLSPGKYHLGSPEEDWNGSKELFVHFADFTCITDWSLQHLIIPAA